VRNERWKYVRYPNRDAPDELYDLQADPYEQRNLAADPASRPTLDQLKDELTQLLEVTPAATARHGL